MQMFFARRKRDQTRRSVGRQPNVSSGRSLCLRSRNKLINSPLAPLLVGVHSRRQPFASVRRSRAHARRGHALWLAHNKCPTSGRLSFAAAAVIVDQSTSTNARSEPN